MNVVGLYSLCGVVLFVGFQELVSRVETSLEGVAAPQRQRRRVYSSRHRLRRDMVGDNPIYQLFVSGSSTGSDKLFFCKICHRDVSMESRGALNSHVTCLGSAIGSRT